MGITNLSFCLWTQGLRCSCCYCSVIILFHFTLGVFLAKRKFSFDVVLKSPPVYAIIISVLFLYFKLEVPVFLENTTFLLTYATIFLVLMSLGIALTRFKVFFKRLNYISLRTCYFGSNNMYSYNKQI